MNRIKIIIVLILFIYSNSANRKGNHKLIYQKDMSEHCRRRVLPSIFLGRQVMNANSQILQFSRLELPYSCFISIRTESGSNMIMMIQLASNDLKQSCGKNSEQLLVYEIGETFGGYWGPMPDSILRQTPYNSKMYTIKRTHKFTSESSKRLKLESVIDEQVSEIPKTSTSAATETSQRDYVEVEIPIVNVSVRLVPNSGKGPAKSFDPAMVFDLENNVTPLYESHNTFLLIIKPLSEKFIADRFKRTPDQPYDTRIMPLMQFSVSDDLSERRLGDDGAPRYELDIVGDFTPDMRLTLPQLSATKRRKQYHSRRYQATRRLNFKKHKNLIDTQKYHNRLIVPGIFTKYQLPTKRRDSQTRSTKFNESWNILEDIIKKLNVNTENTSTTSYDEAVMENIAKLDHNISAYLMPQWSHKLDWKMTKLRKTPTLSYDKLNFNYVKTATTVSNSIEPTIPVQSMSVTSKGTHKDTEIPYKQYNTTKAFNSNGGHYQIDDKIRPLLTNQSEDIESNIVNDTSVTEAITTHNYTDHKVVETTQVTNSKRKTITSSLVGHESWENLVHAAPEMAIKLNQTVAYDINSPQLNETRHEDKLLRKKREIHSINIENARPHRMTTKSEIPTTTTARFQVADMQEFAQLVELQDNELHGRIALRYLRQYVGPALYNLCDLAESAPRHVHLFNSSRIVLAISNFTLDRVIVILTSARTLLSGETRCPASHLECQVSGARVCLDSMVACDGIPNCGSFDIYDEDRLLCGESIGLQHNVYLATFTFLAVLMTLLYAIHYWLKRCVPKVADAFFIYTNGIENVLYLDTIMRSPNDTDTVSRLMYQNSFLEDNNIYDDLKLAVKQNLCKRFLRKCCACFKKTKDNVTNFVEREEEEQVEETYSGTFATSQDNAVQTGESLEMKFLEMFNRPKELANIAKKIDEMTEPMNPPLLIQDSILTLEEPLPREEDELSLVKFFRGRRDSAGSNISSNISVLNFVERPKLKDDGNKEIELISYTYDGSSDNVPGPSGMSTAREKRPKGGLKHLRFDDVATMIPIEEFADETEDDQAGSRHSVQQAENKHRRQIQNLDTIDEDDDQSPTLKDTFHFWGTSRLAGKLKIAKKKPPNPR